MVARGEQFHCYSRLCRRGCLPSSSHRELRGYVKNDSSSLSTSTALSYFIRNHGIRRSGRRNVEKHSLVENLDGVFLVVDEIVDRGVILESDPQRFIQKVNFRVSVQRHLLVILCHADKAGLGVALM
ncbi:Coatomer subunit zeta-2 [Acipenser ruthenus]|uniref:Coatomer subunit zeta n=1 Tax=Acipenser ruthenus TaxID=7906 RepID=A0A444UP37_ACIRT|nr:Coatomer subunit zeta-2 [Acipenser ruthenus]